ncbi:MAG: hypothetical protein HYU66_17205 [Armatimonadetes bacterium]|nr:hypothetical protein [Armatimonadota bacterium]
MSSDRWQELRRLLNEVVTDYAGRVEYGNLRLEVYDGDSSDGQADARLAMAYEIPGGSTNQVGVSYEEGAFRMLDAKAEDELVVADPGEVVAKLHEHIRGIPDYRRRRLRQDIDQWLHDGSTQHDVLEELNRLLRLGYEFRGGTVTVDELIDACCYLVDRPNSGG